MYVVTDANKLSLGLESTLQGLQLWDVQIELDSPGNELVRLFEQESLLPGIILTKNQHYFGMVSRRIFFEKMSNRYSFELYSQRPIEVLYKILEPAVFELTEETTIVAATQIVLQRIHQYIYEPILVKGASERYKVLDFHSLLLAYSQINVLTLAQLRQAEEQSKAATTDLRKVQHNYTQLVQNENEKMAAFGQHVTEIVAGVVHEINNPVKFITGNLIHANRYIQQLLQIISLYQQYYPHPVIEIKTAIAQFELKFITTEIPKLLSSIKVASKYVQQILSSLKNLSYLDESKKKAVDIHQDIDMTLLFLQNRLKPYPGTKENITIIKEYGNLTLMECYPGQLNQVFMYILSHAINTLDSGIKKWNSKAGKEQDQFSNQKSASPTIRVHTEMAESTHVIIRIAHNGSGMTEASRQQIFTPLFTKGYSEGTGMGLSICYEIVVEQYGGQIECISSVGQGTEFIIKIPVKNERSKQLI